MSDLSLLTGCAICGYSPPPFDRAQGLGLDHLGHCQTCANSTERWHEPEVETCHWCARPSDAMLRVDGGKLACVHCVEQCGLCERLGTEMINYEPQHGDVVVVDRVWRVCSDCHEREGLDYVAPAEPERGPLFPDTEVTF